MEHAVVYEVCGVVNNVPVVIGGRGTMRKSGLSVEQSANREAFHWDAALIASCCLDALLAVAVGATPLPESGLPEPVRSWAMLFDDNNREVGRAFCTGFLAVDDGVLRLTAEFREAAFRLELGERITRIGAPYPVGVLPAGDVRVVLTSAWSFETDRGNAYWGAATTARDVYGGGGAARMFSVEAVSIERGARLRVDLRTA